MSITMTTSFGPEAALAYLAVDVKVIITQPSIFHQ